MPAITIRQIVVHQSSLHGCGDGCGDLHHRVPGPVAWPEFPATPKLIGHVFQEPVALPGQELCCGRPERCEFLVSEADDRRQGLISL